MMLCDHFVAVGIRYDFIHSSCAILPDNAIHWHIPDNGFSSCHIKGTASHDIKMLELTSW